MLGTLQFPCPNTGREFDSGIGTDSRTLFSIRLLTVRARCAACGEFHEWPAYDGRIVQQEKDIFGRTEPPDKGMNRMRL